MIEELQAQKLANEELTVTNPSPNPNPLTLTLTLTLTLALALALTLPQNPNPNPEPGPEQVISETTETEVVVGLAAMRRATFAYTLANGTLGVYAQPGQRTWRVKSKRTRTRNRTRTRTRT